MFSVTSFDVCVVSIILIIVLLLWISMVLSKDRVDPILDDLKKRAVVDGLISRVVLGELIKDAIEKGIWSP